MSKTKEATTASNSGAGSQAKTSSAKAAVQPTTELKAPPRRQLPPNIHVAQKALATPRRYRLANGDWVGIGGSIVTEAKPPQLPTIILEATDEQYAEIAETSNLVTITE